MTIFDSLSEKLFGIPLYLWVLGAAVGIYWSVERVGMSKPILPIAAYPSPEDVDRYVRSITNPPPAMKPKDLPPALTPPVRGIDINGYHCEF